MGRKTKEHWTKFCADWNAKYPIGTAVVLKKDSNEEMRTKTRSTAYVSDSGYPVIFLEGVTGYYIMDRIIPTEPRIDTRKRKKPMKVFAGFCPLCGVSLQGAPTSTAHK